MTVQVEVRHATHRSGDTVDVKLNKEKIEELGILSGDTVYISGNSGVLEGFSILNNEEFVELTDEERENIGVEVGDTVTITDEKQGTTVSSSASDTSTPESEEMIPDVQYSDIGGLDDELFEIRKMIELPLQRPDLFEEVGVSPPTGVLLHGPPGTGKTMIARAIANETDAEFFKIDGPEIMSKYYGESEERLRETFENARNAESAIIFFDEIDSIGVERDSNGGDVENRVVGQLLSLMDGLDSSENVIVIGATNRVDTIDNALRRSGRFDREILIGAPNKDERKEIIQIHFENTPLADDVDFDALAEQTNGFVGADIAALARESSLVALMRNYDMNVHVDEVLTGEVDDDISVSMEDINKGMTRVEPSALRNVSAKQPTETYDDVGGFDDEKDALEEIIHWPIKKSEAFSEMNTKPKSGIILEGKEGVGKSLLSKAAAGEFDVNFVSISGASIREKKVGESEERVKEIFSKAEKAAPVVIFFEQMDSIASTEMIDTTGVKEKIIAQLATELDKISSDPNITVIGETTDADTIDPRLIQPGRFEEVLTLEPPDGRQKREILEVITNDKPLHEDLSLGVVATNIHETDENATGGDIQSIVRNASLQAIRRGENKITKDDFDSAIERVLE